MVELGRFDQYHTWREINEQANALEETIAELSPDAVRLKPELRKAYELFSGGHSEIIFTGCGSSYYLSMIAAHKFGKARGRARALPASELMLYAGAHLERGGQYLVVAISRSGETTEVARALERLRREYRIRSVGVTCYGQTAIARLCDAALVLVQGQEESVVMTKAFCCILLALYLIADRIAGGGSQTPLNMPDIVREALGPSSDFVQRIARDPRLQNFVFLGSGPFYGLACEAMLKIKEMASVHSVACHTLEFRHGHKAQLDAQSLVTIFYSQGEAPYLESIIADVKKAKARAFIIGNRVDPNLLSAVDYHLNFNYAIDEYAQALFYLHIAQLLAFWRAVAHGMNPDRPKHLSKVVTF